MACSDSDYAYLRELVLTQSANLIDPSRNALFDSRLAPVAKAAGAADVEDLVHLLRLDQPTHLYRAIAEAMTICETSFFRDVTPFDVLRHAVFPRLIAQNSDLRQLRIWSAACSTGQEAYSLAMLLCEHFPELEHWDVTITGTDISTQVLDYARRARFRRLEVNRGLPARLLVKYFKHDGEEWELKPRVRAMCQFEYANLCLPLPELPVFDLVLLRNVLLYFPQRDRSDVFSAVFRQMAHGGYLVLGNAEQAEDSTNLFEAESFQAAYFYRPVAGS
jgi:chemotaxis protein methyltransferase CheR